MKKPLTLLLAISLTIGLCAQKPVKTVSKDITLSVQSEDGYNALAVAYNPQQNVYYSVYAGNPTFPLEVHDASTGKSLATQQIGADVRGLWYNEKKKQLQGVLMNNEGSFSIDLQEGKPTVTKIDSLAYGMDYNDVAAYYKNKIYFLNGSGLHVFKMGNTKAVKKLYPEVFEKVGIEMFNLYGFFHTGVKGYEIGLYNYDDAKLYLINAKNGKTAAVVNIDYFQDYPELDRFKISFANKRMFLYNVNSRTWDGYLLFN